MAVEFPITSQTPFPLGLRGNAHRPGNFNHLALVSPPPRLPAPKSTPWHRTTVSTFDQMGSNCTIEMGSGLLITLPYRYQFQPDRYLLDSEQERFTYYQQKVQAADPWEGGELWVPGQPGEFYEGSSTDAPFICFRADGIITGWKWLRGEEELWEYLSFYGPAGVGTVWKSGMFHPNSQGYIEVSGSDAGGHAYEIAWASHARQAYRMINSWGTNWGQLGRAWITRANMKILLDEGGEAVTVAL